jgi:hypothetical protein
VELMDADDWRKIVEKKLQVVQCNNCEKVLLASHQLSSPAADWWDAYVEAYEEPESINWSEFIAAFHAHHVLQGVIKLKKEFQDLKLGSMSVKGVSPSSLNCLAMPRMKLTLMRRSRNVS